MESTIEIFALPMLTEVSAGDDLAQLILKASIECPIKSGDILVVAQKIVSKSENASIDLKTVQPSMFAKNIADQSSQDARLVEVILQQSKRVVKMMRGVLIVETHHGFICANAGVDLSNVAGQDVAVVLPSNPDVSARSLRRVLEGSIGGILGVIVSDSFNRPWRKGSMNIAIGVSGLEPMNDMRGEEDDHGRVLKSTIVATADEVASAAQLVMNEKGRHPIAVVRGLKFQTSNHGASDLIREPDQDLFR